MIRICWSLSMANCCANVEALRLQHKSAHRQRFQRFPDNFRNLSDYMDYQVQYHPSLSLMGTLTCFPGFSRVPVSLCQSVPPSRHPSLGTWRCSEHNRHKIHKNISIQRLKDIQKTKKINKVSTKKQRGMWICTQDSERLKDEHALPLYLRLTKQNRAQNPAKPALSAHTLCCLSDSLCDPRWGMHDMLITSVESDSAQTISNGLKRLLFDTSVILTKPNPIKPMTNFWYFCLCRKWLCHHDHRRAAWWLHFQDCLSTRKASPEAVQTQCSQNLPTKSTKESEYVWVRCCQTTSLHSSPWPQMSSWAAPFLNTGPEPSKVTAWPHSHEKETEF